MSSPADASTASPSESTKHPLAPRRWHLKLAPWLACAVAVGAVLYTVSNWNEWTSRRAMQSTQNAFVKSEPAVLSARVGGYIIGLPVADYQTVKAGEIIAEIESDDYAIGVRAAKASLAEAQALVDNLGNEESE